MRFKTYRESASRNSRRNSRTMRFDSRFARTTTIGYSSSSSRAAHRQSCFGTPSTARWSLWTTTACEPTLSSTIFVATAIPVSVRSMKFTFMPSSIHGHARIAVNSDETPNQAVQRMPHACHSRCSGICCATHGASLTFYSLGHSARFAKTDDSNLVFSRPIEAFTP